MTQHVPDLVWLAPIVIALGILGLMAYALWDTPKRLP